MFNVANFITRRVNSIYSYTSKESLAVVIKLLGKKFSLLRSILLLKTQMLKKIECILHD